MGDRMKNRAAFIVAGALCVGFVWRAKADGAVCICATTPSASQSTSASGPASPSSSVAPPVASSAAVDMPIETPEDEVEDQPIVTNVPAPVAYTETPTVSPSYGYVWTPGYWGWGNGYYRWNSGYWRRPPAYGYSWSPARWSCMSGSCAFSPGRWVSPTGVVVTNRNYYVGSYANRAVGRPAVVSGYRPNVVVRPSQYRRPVVGVPMRRVAPVRSAPPRSSGSRGRR